MKHGICKLCLLEKDLQDSHLMPAGIYRRTRSPGAEVQDPVSVTNGRLVATSEQLTDFVFCSECEHRFDKNGENYVQRLVSTKDGFPLLEKLAAAQHQVLGNWHTYTEKATPEVDRVPIAYFAISVFWRASIHVWKWRDGHTTTINMGHQYNEACRLYLLGEAPFPANISLFLAVATDAMTQDAFAMPALNGRAGGGWLYSFGARGMIFGLTVGKLMPKESRDACCVTSPERWIFTRDYKTKTLQAIADKVPREIIEAWADAHYK